jgi:hypothetical protein
MYCARVLRWVRSPPPLLRLIPASSRQALPPGRLLCLCVCGGGGRALLRVGRYKDAREVLQAYDSAGFVRLHLLHDALEAVGQGPHDEQGLTNVARGKKGTLS